MNFQAKAMKGNFFMTFLQKTQGWMEDARGVSSIEAAFIFPIMLLLFIGVYDIGNAVLMNEKVIRSSQIVADLITRENVATDDSISEAIEAGGLAFAPYSTDSYGVDIVSIRFDEDADSEIVWRETVNMSPVSDVLDQVASLATENDGVMVVSVVYRYEPLFSDYVIGSVDMQEMAFSRGRSVAVISKE